MNRTLKRIIIIIIYLTIFGAVGGCTYNVLRAPATCSDGKQNQTEKGIDCGGVCGACAQDVVGKKLIVEEAALIRGGQDAYDVIAKIRNPNPLLGAERFYYTVTLYDEDQVEIVKRSGTSLILPQQERLVAELNIPSKVIPGSAKLIITDVDWIKFADFADPDFIVAGSQFGKVQTGIHFAEVFGIVHNRSSYDFTTVDALVVLRDPQDKIIAANKTRMGAFEAFEQRDFRLNWNYPFAGEIASMDVDIEVDVYDSQNFLQENAIEGGGLYDQSGYR